MSRFFSGKYAALEAYVPGEQPRDAQFIKLNTNESPFPPSEKVAQSALREAKRLELYSDPECTDIRAALSAHYGVSPERIIAVNGSDEVLNFAFMAFGDDAHPFAFPDISYGFYPVFAAVNRVPYVEIPLRDDFFIDWRDYCGIGKNIVIANPNAPTGICLAPREIEQIVRTNPGSVVIIDEAYVDFGGESVLPLTEKYDNLLVTRTFSKSFSLAGGRLGFGIGSEELIADLNTLRNSTNPYNVNRMSAAAGCAALSDSDYYMKNAGVIAETRDFTARELKARGFTVTPSAANFIFAKASFLAGGELYARLREKGILVRHWDKARISDYCRITIGTMQQMQALLCAADEIKSEVSL